MDVYEESGRYIMNVELTLMVTVELKWRDHPVIMKGNYGMKWLKLHKKLEVGINDFTSSHFQSKVDVSEYLFQMGLELLLILFFSEK